jgi:hypothetical protein
MKKKLDSIITEELQSVCEKLFQPDVITKFAKEQEKAYLESKSIRDMTNISLDTLRNKYA